MKKENDANGKSNASDSRPCAMLGAGNLAASLWKFGDEESGWRYRFNIFRMSKANGRVSHRLLPHDVADLAKLAQTLAFALSEEECLDRELRDDLGCLFACLDEVLPSALENVSRHPRLSDATVTLLRTILRRYVDTEECHFGENPFADHIYRKLLLIDRWLEGVISPERAVLPDVDFDSIRETFGVCPLCGNCDECVNLGDYHWYVCRRHQFRWCVGHNCIVPEVYENEESYQENWERIRKYRVVEPLRPRSANSRSQELTS
jgi:hypothetical protein